MLTAITEVLFVDIRPLDLTLERYSGKRGSILELPFDDSSVTSLSSLHVIEHIGLGRYGDPIDPDGAVKASEELKRVLAPKGRLYISVPIGKTRVQFNGQRVFAIEDILGMFANLNLIELAVVDAHGNYKEKVDPYRIDMGEDTGLDFGLGMFIFERDGSLSYE
jgi:SAM-dependent methyltransferase